MSYLSDCYRENPRALSKPNYLSRDSKVEERTTAFVESQCKTKEDDTKEDDTKEDDTKEDDTKEDDTKEDDTKDDDTKEDDTKDDDTKEDDTKEDDTNLVNLGGFHIFPGN